MNRRTFAEVTGCSVIATTTTTTGVNGRELGVRLRKKTQINPLGETQTESGRR